MPTSSAVAVSMVIRSSPSAETRGKPSPADRVDESPSTGARCAGLLKQTTCPARRRRSAATWPRGWRCAWSSAARAGAVLVHRAGDRHRRRLRRARCSGSGSNRCRRCSTGTDDITHLHSHAGNAAVVLGAAAAGASAGWSSGVILNWFTPDGRVRSVADVIEGAALRDGRVERRAGLGSALASLITLVDRRLDRARGAGGAPRRR